MICSLSLTAGLKEQETQGDKQENKADNNLSDAVFNFTPADSGIEMMDANMPEMAENPKQEETSGDSRIDK